MNDARFTIPEERLAELVREALRSARALGATDCAAEASEGGGLSVTVRKGKVETIEQNRDKLLGVTVYVGQRRGNASTSDFSAKAVGDTVRAAWDIARFTAEDDCAGLPDADALERAPRPMALCFPWAIETDAAIGLAKRMEDAAFATDRRITNSDGASVSAQQTHFVMGNSRGFEGGFPTSRHYLSVSPIAGRGNDMQRDDWHSSMRDPADLAAPEAIGRYAAERALSRLGARKLSTRKCPVLFEAPLACGLAGTFVQAVSGGALYRKSSFLLDSLGKPAFAPHVQLVEDPFVPKGLGSSPFDEEGCRVRQREVVADGIVRGYFLSTYSARKLGMRSTGNAGGAHNLTLSSSLTRSSDDLDAMLRRMGRGLLVTELMGQGVNYVTGDYSRGAVGYWVEGGRIVHPVHEVTIAGNMRDMFRGLAAIGSDVATRGGRQTGSILIDEMTVAGS